MGGKLQFREQTTVTVFGEGLCINILSIHVEILGASLGFHVPPGISQTCLSCSHGGGGIIVSDKGFITPRAPT